MEFEPQLKRNKQIQKLSRLSILIFYFDYCYLLKSTYKDFCEFLVLNSFCL